MQEFQGQSFVANIHADTAEYSGPITTVALGEPTDDAWCVRRDEIADPLSISFDYVGEYDGRSHYRLSAGVQAMEYEGATLGVSPGGYLGFFQDAESVAIWELEWVESEADEGAFHFNLFDALGQQVSIVREAGAIDDEQEDWLVVGQGDAVILRVQVVD
jgi:hypothetical protein